MILNWIIVIILDILVITNGLSYPKPPPIDPSDVELRFDFDNITLITGNPIAAPFVVKGNNTHSYSTHYIYITDYNQHNVSDNGTKTITRRRMPGSVPLIDFYRLMTDNPLAPTTIEDISAQLKFIGQNTATMSKGLLGDMGRAAQAFKYLGRFADIIGVVSDGIQLWLLFTQKSEDSQIEDALKEIISTLKEINTKIDALSVQIKSAVVKLEKFDLWENLEALESKIYEQYSCTLISGNLSISTDIDKSTCCPNNWNNTIQDCQHEVAANINSDTGINFIDIHHQLFSLLTGSGAYNGGNKNIQTSFSYIYAKNLWEQLYEAIKQPDGTYDFSNFNTSSFLSIYGDFIVRQRMNLARSGRVLVWSQCMISGKGHDNCYKMWQERSQDMVSLDSYATYFIPDMVSILSQDTAGNLTRTCDVYRNTTGDILNVTCNDFKINSTVLQRVYVKALQTNCMCFRSQLDSLCFENDCLNSKSGGNIAGIGGVILKGSGCNNLYSSIYIEPNINGLSADWYINDETRTTNFNIYNRNNSLSAIWANTDNYELLSTYSSCNPSITFITKKSICNAIKPRLYTCRCCCRDESPCECDICGDESNCPQNRNCETCTTLGPRFHAQYMDSFDELITGGDDGRAFYVYVQIPNINDWKCNGSPGTRWRYLVYNQNDKNWPIYSRECPIGGDISISNCDGHGCIVGDTIIAPFTLHTEVSGCDTPNIEEVEEENDNQQTNTIIILIVVVGIIFVIIIILLLVRNKFKNDRTVMITEDGDNNELEDLNSNVSS
eukprot:314271_1